MFQQLDRINCVMRRWGCCPKTQARSLKLLIITTISFCSLNWSIEHRCAHFTILFVVDKGLSCIYSNYKLNCRLLRCWSLGGCRWSWVSCCSSRLWLCELWRWSLYISICHLDQSCRCFPWILKQIPVCQSWRVRSAFWRSLFERSPHLSMPDSSLSEPWQHLFLLCNFGLCFHRSAIVRPPEA